MSTIPAILLGLALPIGAPKADGPVDYLRDVKPILAAHCIHCHGAEKPRGKLRLDTAAAALEGGPEDAAVIPGRPDESLLYLAVIGEGDSERMPLRRPPLSEMEIATLRAWIEQGRRGPRPTRSPPSPAPKALGLRRAAEARAAPGPGRGLGPQPDRPLHPRPRWSATGSPRRPRPTAPP
jgi:mono/diheme cytochrome c family protein